MKRLAGPRRTAIAGHRRGPHLGALGVEHHGDADAAARGGLAARGRCARRARRGAVGEVDARDVHARVDHRGERLGRVAGGADRRDDLRESRCGVFAACPHPSTMEANHPPCPTASRDMLDMLREPRRADDVRQGRPAVVPRPRLEGAAQRDRRAGGRPGHGCRRRGPRRRSRASARAPPRRSASCSDGQGRQARRAAAPATRPGVGRRFRASRGSGRRRCTQLRARAAASSRSTTSPRWRSRRLRWRSRASARSRRRARRSRSHGSAPRARWVVDTDLEFALPLTTRLVARCSGIPGVDDAATCGSLSASPDHRQTSTSWSRARRAARDRACARLRPTPSSGHSGAVPAKTSVRHAPRHAGRPRVGRPEQLARGALYFTGGRAPTSSSPAARSRAAGRLNGARCSEVEGGRVVAQRAEERSTPRSACPGSRRCCARLRRDHATERGTLPEPLATL